MKYTPFLLILILAAGVLAGKDYYLAPAGSDGAPGSKSRPFATFKRALRALKAGDTLHIAPGDYAGAGVQTLKGQADKKIIIRAEIPGTVVIRGDKVVKGFKPVPGAPFIYVIDRKEPAGGVKERDTLTYYTPVGALALLKYERGVWFHDTAKGKLYIVTSDGRHPDEHLITVCGGDPREDHGLQLINQSQHVHFDGLNFTGFDSYVVKWGNNYYTIKSLLLNHSDHIKVTNCRFFLNGSGLSFWACRNALVEDCTAYANGSLAVGSAANIYFYGRGTADCTVRRCTAFKSHLSGIRFYSGPFPGCLIEKCAAWGHRMSDLEIKAPDNKAMIRESIALKNATNTNVRNNVISSNSFRLTPASDPSSFYYRKLLPGQKLSDHLADFDNFDARPMSDSKLKGGMTYDKTLYFISPTGKESAHGHSIRSPKSSLKTIPSGATVYLMPGKYGQLVIDKDKIRLAGRGRYTRALVSRLTVNASNVTLRKINFTGPVTVRGNNVKFENCSFAQGVDFSNSKDFVLVHCAFVKTAPRAENSSGAVFSSILPRQMLLLGKSRVYSDNNAYPAPVKGEPRSIVCKALFKAPEKGDFTLKNPEAFAGHALDALPIGPYNRLPGVPGRGALLAKVHKVTPDSAELQWYQPTGKERVTLRYRSGKDRWRYLTPQGEVFRNITVTGLKPGRKYVCEINVHNVPEERYLNTALTPAEEKALKRKSSPSVLTFTTPVRKAAPREYFVSVKGSDRSSGTKAAPFRTIGYALEKASPGDTVTVREGTYSENLVLRCSDLTLRGAPGEKVWLDGQRKLLNFISFYNKRNITIDNFRMKALITTKKQYIKGINSRNIRLSRIFFDGRWAMGYTPTPLYLSLCSDVLIENCVTMYAFRGLHFVTTDKIRVRNCVLSMNSLNQLHFTGFPENFKAVIENNIICDIVPVKLPNALIHVPHDHPGISIENNCFYTRIGPEKRNFAGTWLGKGSGLHPIAHYRKAHPGKETNIFRDPKMPGLKLHKPPFKGDETKKEYRATADGKSWEVLDFKDFFPAHLEVRRRGMGLRESEVR